ncbi:MAG: ABC transporter permease [Plesiomonas shigelloides]
MTHDPRPAIWKLFIAGGLLMLLLGCATYYHQADLPLNLLAKRQIPSAEYWLGTDNLGRDLLIRCLQGVYTSWQIGLIASLTSGAIALCTGVLSALGGKRIDMTLRWLIDSMLSIPHLILLLLLCFTLGGGKQGVIMAVALTHWPKLALLIRAEVLRIKESDFIRLAAKLGNSRWHILRVHYLPLLLPQILVGILLMFPHAILHAAALSFLGFGLAQHEASLGLLLADALRYLNTGAWWLALFPGLFLVALVMLIEQCGHAVQQLWQEIL